MDLPVCSYRSSEEITWYLSTYDYWPITLDDNGFPCIFCNLPIRRLAHNKHEQCLDICDFCGFWRVISLRGLAGFRNAQPHLANRGVAKFFNVDALDAPVDDLRRFLKRNPRSLAHVNPFVFEELIVDCLRSAFPKGDIVKIGGIKDRGIDIILVKEGTESHLVQIKRRSNLYKNEGVDVVRQLNGVLYRENIARGIVITTAKKYTANAKNERMVKSNDGVWEAIELFGYDDIVKWLRLEPAEPYEPWTRFTRGATFSDWPVAPHRR